MKPAEKMSEIENQNSGDAEQKTNASPEGGGGDRKRQRNRSASPATSVNMDELRELIDLVRENDFVEFELEHEGFRVHFRRGGEPAPESAEATPQLPGSDAKTGPAVSRPEASSLVPSHPGAGAETAASEDQDLHIIPSPIVGTFYRSPSPTAEVFVKMGSRVEPDTVVCIIEAMKLMNKIYVENGQAVEYGQPLFGIKK
jgi:acetyl-CoA carboxylase biotin carboxyl carrier protein